MLISVPLNLLTVKYTSCTKSFDNLNKAYMNKANNSSGEKPPNYVSDTNLLNDGVASNNVVQYFSSQPSKLKISENFGNSQNIRKFQFHSASCS